MRGQRQEKCAQPPTVRSRGRGSRVRTPLFTTGLSILALASCGGGGGGSGGSSGSTSSGDPELLIESVTFSPSQANIGETIYAVDIIKNDGAGTAAGFDVEIYLSLDPFITSADTLIGMRSIAGLNPGETSVGGGFLTLPPTLSEGLWYLGVIVDRAGEVAEGNEADNVQVAFQTLEVSTVPAPDLSVNLVTVNVSQVEAGQLVEVSDTTQNVGVGDATSFQIGIYLSLDATITPGDVLLGLRSVPFLGAGEITQLSGQLTVPAATTPGTWFVGALADVGGIQNESDEFNNTGLAAQPLTVTAPPRPDLRMTELTFSPNALDAGQSLTVSETVINQGLMPADPFRVGIFLSSDETIDGEDHLIGFRSLAGLSIGEGSSTSAPLVVPAVVGGGTFHVAAVADHEESILESNEENNTVIALGTLVVQVPPMPDLETTAVSFGPSVVESGEAVTVIERVRNSGTVPAVNVRVGTYISNNEVVTTSDVLLGTRVISSLGVGDVDEALNEFVVPAGVPIGSWTVGVIADDVAGILEPDEGNNLLVAAGHLDVTGSPDPQADLLVGSLQASPSSVLSGGVLTIQSNIRNEGDLSASQFHVRFYLSQDSVIESTDFLVGVRTIFQLGIDSGSAQSFPYTLDASLPLGDYYFGAICDDPNVILESDEDNNVEVLPGLIEIFVPPPPAPDLTLVDLSFDPASVSLGGQFQVSHTVRNVGNLDAESYRVDYYISLDSEITSDDFLAGSGLTAPSLAIGDEAPSSSQIDLPAEVTVGTWYVGGIVSILTGTADSNLSNDDLSASTTLEVTL